MSCPNCGGTMIGDGHNTVLHCEFATEADYEFHEPDAQPVLCRKAKRPGYNFCTRHQQEYLQYCSLCALEDRLDPIIKKGADAGKRESELAAEIFDPGVSDAEYFQRRKDAHAKTSSG